jgi:hypothetical protein
VRPNMYGIFTDAEEACGLTGYNVREVTSQLRSG